jgi:hypothetical protein
LELVAEQPSGDVRRISLIEKALDESDLEHEQIKRSGKMFMFQSWWVVLLKQPILLSISMVC